MKITVKIDKNSIKKNPKGGERTTYHVPGVTMPDGRGGMHRSVQICSSLTPEPYYFYKHLPCTITCDKCSKDFLKEDLIEYEETIEDYEEYDECDEYEECTYEVLVRKCPHCEKELDIEFKFEKLNSNGEVAER